MNVGMSNSVTTAIRDSIRNTAVGRIRSHDKAHRATVEKVFKCSLLSGICSVLCLLELKMSARNLA
jgi:hypothetical protein